MAKQAKQATEQAVAPVAGNAPTHTAVAYRGEKGRRVQLGVGWVAKSGVGINVQLDFLPGLSADGVVEQFSVFPIRRENGNG